MLMNEEKIVKINNIQISKTGFKNLQFETSRTSERLEILRGFGGLMKEKNLNIIDTVSMDFVLNYYELKELAYIYCLFKANGILPIENEYFLKKIKSTYEKGKSEEEITKDPFIKENISHLICFLEKLSLTSIERTNNSYKVNIVLTLYDNVLTKEEFEAYMIEYTSWNMETGFEALCYENINEIIENLKQQTNLELKIYNVETLNSTYKEHILNNASINAKLNDESEDVNEQKAQTLYNKSKSEILKNKKTLDISKLGTTVTIPNDSILQIELITQNNIANVPILGSPIGNKSYLGVGQTFFSAKLIFNEYENEIVESLKRLSDKNIINHKIEINHPLIQLFDFYTSNIVNIIFNNLEEANGIMINIIFALNGFRYSEEATINTDEILDKVKYDNDFKQEQIGGLYLEYLADYVYKNRDNLTNRNLQHLMSLVLESKVVNNEGEDNNSLGRIFTHNYPFVNLLSSYSSFPTCFGIHKYTDNTLEFNQTLFSYPTNSEYLNSFFNKDVDVVDLSKEASDIFYLEYTKESLRDSDLNVYRNLYNSTKYYSYIDNLSAITILGNIKYRQKVSNYLYSNSLRPDTYVAKVYAFKNLINDVIKKLSIELFNTKQNGDLDIYKNEIYKKLYDEFFYRLFYILNYSLVKKIDEIKEKSFISSNGYSILFTEIYKNISEISDSLYETMIKTFYDGDFLERITKEVIEENLKPTEKINVDIETKIKTVKENMIDFTLEFVNNYNGNKEKIRDRAYNIFLTKINYFMYMYSMNGYGNKYEKEFDFIDNIIKIYLLSSSVHSILLSSTSTRTDHFNNSIVLGLKNIGYKISKYNSSLEDNPDGSNCMFYELFKNDNKNNEFLYYKNKIEYNDFKYYENTIFNSIPNKDINFFYGNKINLYDLYGQLIDIITPIDFKNEENDLKIILEEEKNKYITNQYKESSNEEIQLDVSYSEVTLDINNIDFPFMNFGFIPSHYTELFYNIDNGKYIMNERMKQRVTGNIDVFKNVEEISKIVFDRGKYIIPDYNILISKKEYDKETNGNTYRTINDSISISLKNVSSINVIKNPKTKIKTLNLVLTNTSKSIFNFNQNNGSFDIKSLNNGKIDIIHIEPGDEIRITLGFNKKAQVFNGFINIIENTGNQLILACSSFTSALYNNKISELDMSSSDLSILKSIGNFFKGILNKSKTTLTEIPKVIYENIRNSYISLIPLNDHLFKLNNQNYNSAFQICEKASMYSAFSLSLSSISTSILNNFLKSKVNDITQSKLATETYLKKSLDSVLGSMALSYENIGTTPDLYKNINNVDVDYENYGMLYWDIVSYYSKNSYKQQTSKKENNTNNSSTENSDNNNILYPENIPTTEKPNNSTSSPENAPVKENSNNNISSLGNIPIKENNTLNYGITHLPVESGANIITSLFKERRNKNNKFTYHKGIDICNPTKMKELDNIYTVADGTVVFSSSGVDAGNYIKILHKIPNQKDKYFVSGYMHLNERLVKTGTQVKAGDKIGVMGNTGYSSGKHLHFEMYTSNSSGTSKNLLLNPFGENMLPDNNWNVDWNSVNILADNGRYTEEWKEAYSNSKKTVEYRKSLEGSVND